MDRWKTIIEPFRTHAVEPIRMTTLADQDAELERAGYTLFNVAGPSVLVDLLTDSGTGSIYVIEVCRWVAERAGEPRGLRIVEEPPRLRHFTARFAPL